jgi:hypothetical protein
MQGDIAFGCGHFTVSKNVSKGAGEVLVLVATELA